MKSQVLTLAKKELTDTTRAWTLWGAIAGLVLMASSATFSVYFKTPDPASFGTVSTNIVLHLSRLTPVVALLIGYKTIVGERQSGSLRYLLSHPITRTEVLLGKLLGRSAVFILSVVITVAILVAENIALYGGIGVFELFVHATFLLLYGLVWLAVGLGISATMRSQFRATSAIFVIYVVTHFFWQQNLLPLITYTFTGDSSLSRLKHISVADGPTWYLYVQRLNPLKTFQAIRGVLLEFIGSDPANVDAAITYPINAHANLFGIGVLLLWAIVPLVIGYWRFTRAELT